MLMYTDIALCSKIKRFFVSAILVEEYEET